jgi:sigma-B regulation protein RsbU (phosphoserine phosphatase)
MEIRDFEHFRDLLLERQQTLAEWMNSGAWLRDKEAEAVRGLLNQIKDALGRIENHSFGECEVCDGKVESHRLEIQPISRVCIDCFSAEEKAVLEEDLFLASKIHRALLPQSIPQIKGFELEVRSLAAGNIGGDYYDFLQGPNGDTMRIVIADAMGHGLPAGLLMSNLQGALRILSSDIDHPAPLITRLNQWICRNVPVTKFVSMACMCMHFTGENETRITYANAGHVPPLVVRSDGSFEQLDATGTVLGVHEDFAYEEGSFTVSSGDYLVLYTDGVTEALNARDEEFEQERLVAFIRSRQTEPLEGIVDGLLTSVLEFSGSSQAADDLTAIILRKK